MPRIGTAPQPPVKLLILGDSGSGKTGLLASLAEAGYRLHILDFDLGTNPVLFNFTRPAAHANIIFEPLRDDVSMEGNFMKVKAANAFRRGMSLLDDWIDSETKEKFGAPATFGPNAVVVIDSLSFMAKAALNFVVLKNGHTGKITQPDWGEAQNLVSGCLQKLTAQTFATNLIVMTHINWLEQPVGDPGEERFVVFKGAPSSIGKALNDEIPKYFNTMLGVRRLGTSGKIYTNPSNMIEYKFPVPGAKADYPSKSGLREIFKLLRGGVEPENALPPL